MSDPGGAPSTSSRVLSALMTVVGVILVLPGLCSAYFAVQAIGSPRDPYLSMFIPIWLTSFAVAGGGSALIWWAARRLSR